MKFENTEVFNFEGAFRGMRNPMSSWDKSDSGEEYEEHFGYSLCKYKIGKNDLELAQRLIKAGSEHRKFLRQIFVSVDITAPLFFFKEMDTYKVGTVSNSTSTMHKLASTPITKECFEMDDFEPFYIADYTPYTNITDIWKKEVEVLEGLRIAYNKTKDKRYWKELIRLLPESWLQKRTVTMSYENIFKMVRERINHKLSEWSKFFIDWAKSLPYADDLIFIGGVDG